MWFFKSPEIVHGEGALGYLSEIEGQRAFIVTDQTMVELGFVDLVAEQLKEAGIESQVFAKVEPNPSFEVVKRGAAAMSQYGPDWVIGLGAAPPWMQPRRCGSSTSVPIWSRRRSIP